MSDSIPINALDRAIIALQRSDAATPEFYRRLAEGELWFLVKYHPEIENEVLELKNGSPLPFVRFQEKEGQMVPLFSSEARLNESLKNAKVPAKTYSAASMPARQALQLLGHVKINAIVNRGCSTGTLVIPPELMRDLASGKALDPLDMGGGEPKQVTLTILDPADYPTKLIQPVFELIRKHNNFRAAWIFGPPIEPGVPAKANVYYLLILMDPRDKVLFHDLNMVVQATRSHNFDIEMSLADEKDASYVASLFKQAKPFYIASGFQPPTN